MTSPASPDVGEKRDLQIESHRQYTEWWRERTGTDWHTVNYGYPDLGPEAASTLAAQAERLKEAKSIMIDWCEDDSHLHNVSMSNRARKWLGKC